MHCVRCHSMRIIRFLDGFGKRRIFCKSCHESIPLEQINEGLIRPQRKLMDFADYYPVS